MDTHGKEDVDSEGKERAAPETRVEAGEGGFCGRGFVEVEGGALLRLGEFVGRKGHRGAGRWLW